MGTQLESLTARQRLFAKLRYEDKLPNPELAGKCGIADRTIYEWDKKPEIQVEMERLASVDAGRSQLILRRASVKAAERLEVLTETKTSDPQLAETGRKAACNILDASKLQKPIDEGEKPSLNVYLIQLVQEFRRAASEADGETVNRLIKILEGGNGDEGKQQKVEVGPSPVLLRKPLPSQSSKRTS